MQNGREKPLPGSPAFERTFFEFQTTFRRLVSAARYGGQKKATAEFININYLLKHF